MYSAYIPVFFQCLTWICSSGLRVLRRASSHIRVTSFVSAGSVMMMSQFSVGIVSWRTLLEATRRVVLRFLRFARRDNATNRNNVCKFLQITWLLIKHYIVTYFKIFKIHLDNIIYAKVDDRFTCLVALTSLSLKQSTVHLTSTIKFKLANYVSHYLNSMTKFNLINNYIFHIKFLCTSRSFLIKIYVIYSLY